VSTAPLARSVGGITVALTPPITPDAERATPRSVGLEGPGGGASGALIKDRAMPQLFPELTIDGRVIGGRGLGNRDLGFGIR
jgi:hypothetical protein